MKEQKKEIFKQNTSESSRYWFSAAAEKNALHNFPSTLF